MIIRGDLFSDTGYSRAIRALAAALSEHCDHLFGVSLYEDARRRHNAFDHLVIGEEEILQFVSEGGEVIVINACLPDHFYYAAGAINVAYFFWETEKFPPTAFWLAGPSHCDSLDMSAFLPRQSFCPGRHCQASFPDRSGIGRERIDCRTCD